MRRFERRDAEAVRRFLEQNPELRARINEPVFGFNSPAIVAFANDHPARGRARLDTGRQLRCDTARLVLPWIAAR